MLMEDIYKILTANTTFNGERQNAFPLKSGTRHRCLMSVFPFKFVLDVLANGKRPEKNIKAIQIAMKK